jgi:WD40 repeat protein
MEKMQACPSREQLCRLIAAEMSDPESSTVENHVEVCGPCQFMLEQLTEVSYSQEQPKSSDKEVGPASPFTPSFLDAILHQAPRTAGPKLRHFRAASMSGAPAAGAPDKAWPDLPGYEVVEVLGRGGMSVVYKARQRKLNRWVALKILRGGKDVEPGQRARFQAEAWAVAQLQHPNIVQIHEVGESDGLPYLVLEVVEGGSLAQRVADGPLPGDQAARLVETLARTAHFAHQRHVIHRDLKPANILLASVVNEQGSAATNDGLIPKITDFGLAKQLDADANQSQSGILVGTPCYMAPEQAEGRSKDVGPATDVHALGVILYELLTGRPPFQGASTLQTLEQVRWQEPVPPRRVQPHVPRDLEAITLRCLEKEPGRRYPSALALAEDLRCFQQGKPISARRVGAPARLLRWCRRRSLVALLLALLTVTLFAGLGGVTWKWLEADEQRDRASANARLAEANARQADAEKQGALYQAYRTRLAAAGAALQNHDVADAARQLDDSTTEGLRDWEWLHLSSRLDDSNEVIPAPPSRTLLSPGPQGLRVAILDDQRLRVLNEQGHAERTVPFPHNRGGPWAVTQAPEGLLILDQASRTSARLRDGTGAARGTVQVPADPPISGFGLSPNLKRLAVLWRPPGGFSAGVYDFSGKELARFPDLHRADVWSLVFSPDGTRLASTSDDCTGRLWDAATGRPIGAPLRHGKSRLLSAAFSPDGARLVTAAGNGTVCQWDARTGAAVGPPYERHAGEVWAAVYSPDGQWVASAGSDRTIRLWRAAERQDALILHGHAGRVTQLAFGPDGRRLGSVSDDGTARIWEADPQASLPVLRGHEKSVYPVAYSPDGQWIASGSWDGTVRLWDARTGDACAVLNHAAVVRALAFSPDSSWLVSGGDGDNRLRLWDVATGRRSKEIPGPGARILSVAVSPDGTQIAAVDWAGKLSIREVATGQEVSTVQLGGWGQMKGLAFSPAGRWLACTTPDFQVYLWDAKTYQLSARWSGHTGEVFSVAFSRDGCRLASASLDRTVRVWNVEDGRSEAVLRGHSDDVFTAVFHPRGTRLATAGRDRAVWLWDLATGKEVTRLPGHTDYVWSLAFSPDGKTLASGSGDGTVRLWDTAPLKTRYQARREAAALRPEAERLVELLWREKNDPAEVVKALRADPVPSEPLRQAALRAVLRRARPPEAAPGSPRDAP